MANLLQQYLDEIERQKDTYLLPENLKKDVSLLGVTGTLESGATINNQDITITPSIEEQTVTADDGYTGIGTATVEAVDSSIDENIVSSNIKSGVSILGVSGDSNVVDTSEGTLTRDRILDGYIGYSLGKKYTGTYTPAMTDSEYDSALALSRNILQGYDYTTFVTQHSYAATDTSYEIPNSFHINFDIDNEQYWSYSPVEEFNGYSVGNYYSYTDFASLCKNHPYMAVYIVQQEQNTSVHYRRYLVINTDDKKLFDCLSFDENTVTLSNPPQGAYFAFTTITNQTTATTVANEPADLTYYLDLANSPTFISTTGFTFYSNVDYSDFSYTWLNSTYTPKAYLVATNF